MTAGGISFLSGISVLQLGDGIAGSAAAALLASLGAEVTRASDGGVINRFGPAITTASGVVAAVDLTLDRSKRILQSSTEPTTLIAGHDIVIADHELAVDPPQVEN